MADRHLAILIPIYKPQFEALEQFSIDFSLAQMKVRECFFVAPEGLDCRYYQKRYPQIQYAFFSAAYFQSVDDYSRLLLSLEFYQRFLPREFMLILQPDAVLLRDELNAWMKQPFDYLGAPWPEGLEMTIRRDRFQGELNRRVKAHVGNGGFSLRRIRKCMALLEEFPETRTVFAQNRANEDTFFALLGQLSHDFVLPNEIIASRFAMEQKPEYYYAVNGQHYPMGVHAWSIVAPKFWAPCIPPLAAVL